MAAHKAKSTWSKCLTQLFGHPCPWCSKGDTVFTGHGTARFCTNCTVTWGQAEELDLRSKFAEGLLAEQTFRQKIATLPQNIRRLVNAGVKSIDVASGVDPRLAKLRAISDGEWQKALESSPEPEEI